MVCRTQFCSARFNNFVFLTFQVHFDAIASKLVTDLVKLSGNFGNILRVVLEKSMTMKPSSEEL